MPRVSVLLPAYYSTATLPQCLAGIQGQSFRDFEIVVVNSSPESATGDLIRNHFPEVRFEQSTVRLWPHAAHNRAVRLAEGELFVFLDPDCRMHPDALSRLVAAHEAGHPMVGGAIENATGSWWELGVHFAKFAWWLPGGEPAPRPDLPTAIVLYSRPLWDQAGPFDENSFCGDSLAVERFRRQQGVPWFEPRAIVYHHHVSGMRDFLRERFTRGDDYGKHRTRHRGWTRPCIATQLALLPLLPFLMTARSVRYAASSHRFGDALLTLPVILAGNTAWCLGEALAHIRVLWAR